MFRTIGAIIIALVIYHCAIGASIIMFGIQTDPPLTMSEKFEYAVKWPVVVSATVWMQSKYSIVMDDIKETLDEINSGRWDRKPD